METSDKKPTRISYLKELFHCPTCNKQTKQTMWGGRFATCNRCHTVTVPEGAGMDAFNAWYSTRTTQ